jgi:purine-binding chemotaxis protein CheW
MTRQLCTFHVGELYLGIEVERIQEVLRGVAVTPVPKAPPEVHGLINLRGRIVTAVCLRTVFGLPADERQHPPAMVVLDNGDELISLVVDHAGDVVTVRDVDFEEPPETLQAGARRLIRGAYKLEYRLLLVLDVEHIARLEAGGGA